MPNDCKRLWCEGKVRMSKQASWKPLADPPNGGRLNKPGQFHDELLKPKEDVQEICAAHRFTSSSEEDCRTGEVKASKSPTCIPQRLHFSSPTIRDNPHAGCCERQQTSPHLKVVGLPCHCKAKLVCCYSPNMVLI